MACESTPELGDINEYTARGVWYGMRACLEAAGLKRVRVALQGLGNVGMLLGRILRREGMDLTVADLNQGRARQAELELGARVVAPEEILFVECDVLAPCALGGVVNEQTLPKIRARVAEIWHCIFPLRMEWGNSPTPLGLHTVVGCIDGVSHVKRIAIVD